jgi:SM-20-related protein
VNIQLQNQFDTIADGLADKGYAIIDHFLSADEVHCILQLDDFKNALLHFKQAGIGKSMGKQINEGIRGDYIQWIDKESAAPEIKIYLNRLRELISFINQSLFLSLKDFEVHKTIYPAGTFYKRHLDQFRKDDHRKLSVICYLNEEWNDKQGGQLRMYLPDDVRDVFPTAGKLVCFRSDQIEHEVLPATRERMSLTGWTLDQLNELKGL